MANDTSANETGGERHTFSMTRIVNAPVDVVFAAYTDPQQLRQFWSPAGTSIPEGSLTFEPTSGGRFDVDMVNDANGEIYPMRAHVVSIAEPSEIVFVLDQVGLVSTTTFVDREGKTEITVTHTNAPVEYVGEMAEMGFTSVFDQLEEFLTR